ncbi:hypothetical protein NQ314_004410 [Rhamnusium bicolor]|uniref:ditrans,polycis-polyprenyl diphosphate synthase [(2E,6E)-farnesyldiphosphate specific] n=1 Tax=Rhamnusium bicolor TaxID=1586634 RepID=A0AAV8ZM49_9CUCU|nr:hypothetical protein NQ314_004410 [Rhamnusium bicolor]
MWSINFYRAFYLVFHCAYTIFEYIHTALKYINHKIVDFGHEFLPTTEKNNCIQNQLNKIRTPVHLTVLLGHEEPCYKDLVNLILWCMATRISFISFYDHKGILKKNEQEFQYELDQRNLKEDHVIWHSHSDSTYKNGFIGKKIHVKIITEEDGRNSVVNLTKNLSLTKNRDFSLDNISESLRKQFEFPNPDLGLVCGETFNLYNYPPWQISVTEFLTIKSLRNITFSSFIEQLVRYSKCEQRLGK